MLLLLSGLGLFSTHSEKLFIREDARSYLVRRLKGSIVGCLILDVRTIYTVYLDWQ